MCGEERSSICYKGKISKESSELETDNLSFCFAFTSSNLSLVLRFYFVSLLIYVIPKSYQKPQFVLFMTLSLSSPCMSLPLCILIDIFVYLLFPPSITLVHLIPFEAMFYLFIIWTASEIHWIPCFIVSLFHFSSSTLVR